MARAGALVLSFTTQYPAETSLSAHEANRLDTHSTSIRAATGDDDKYLKLAVGLASSHLVIDTLWARSQNSLAIDGHHLESKAASKPGNPVLSNWQAEMAACYAQPRPRLSRVKRVMSAAFRARTATQAAASQADTYNITHWGYIAATKETTQYTVHAQQTQPGLRRRWTGTGYARRR
jgi:hypothetical protein